MNYIKLQLDSLLCKEITIFHFVVCRIGLGGCLFFAYLSCWQDFDRIFHAVQSLEILGV